MRREIKCFDESYYTTIKDDGCVGTTNKHFFFCVDAPPIIAIAIAIHYCYYFKTEKKRDLTGVFVTCHIMLYNYVYVLFSSY